MTKDLFSRRSLSLSGTLAVLLAGVAAGPALAKSTPGPTVDTSACSEPQLSQPFASLRDMNWYMLTPGERADNFDGGGWLLSNGASIATRQLADGQLGHVLDLPTGSSAVSPPVCVQSDYPTARTMIQTTSGATVAVAVSYAGTKSDTKPIKAGNLQSGGHGWAASDPFNVHPQKPPGWQLVRFILTGHGSTGAAQIYDFFVDPRMKY